MRLKLTKCIVKKMSIFHNCKYFSLFEAGNCVSNSIAASNERKTVKYVQWKSSYMSQSGLSASFKYIFFYVFTVFIFSLGLLFQMVTSKVGPRAKRVDVGSTFNGPTWCQRIVFTVIP